MNVLCISYGRRLANLYFMLAKKKKVFFFVLSNTSVAFTIEMNFLSSLTILQLLQVLSLVSVNFPVKTRFFKKNF